MLNISILLSTYKGSRYLKNQLDSLMAQTYKVFDIIARDDGSSDSTLKILKSYDVEVLDINQNLGAKGSFSELLSYAVANSDSEYFMFCDQDDVWHDKKVEKKKKKMQEMEQQFGNIPLLVHTNLEVFQSFFSLLNLHLNLKVQHYKNLKFLLFYPLNHHLLL